MNVFVHLSCPSRCFHAHIPPRSGCDCGHYVESSDLWERIPEEEMFYRLLSASGGVEVTSYYGCTDVFVSI